jgi:hypothetical protein
MLKAIEYVGHCSINVSGSFGYIPTCMIASTLYIQIVCFITLLYLIPNLLPLASIHDLLPLASIHDLLPLVSIHDLLPLVSIHDLLPLPSILDP